MFDKHCTTLRGRTHLWCYVLLWNGRGNDLSDKHQYQCCGLLSRIVKLSNLMIKYIILLPLHWRQRDHSSCQRKDSPCEYDRHEWSHFHFGHLSDSQLYNYPGPCWWCRRDLCKIFRRTLCFIVLFTCVNITDLRHKTFLSIKRISVACINGFIISSGQLSVVIQPRIYM